MSDTLEARHMPRPTPVLAVQHRNSAERIFWLLNDIDRRALLFRSLFYIVFFMVTFILMYMPDSQHTDSLPAADSFVFVFPSYIILIVTECFVFMFAIYLGVGIYSESVFRVQQYLICRFCAFISEAIPLMILCYNHHYYIGWYLVFLMIIILELYSFIVVYSYYVDLAEQEAKECEDTELCCGSDLNECLRDIQKTQSMRGTQHTRAMRCTSEPRTPRPSLDMREMRNMKNVRDIMPDFRDPRCTKTQDPKLYPLA